jgi:glycosyltransferase involved in cell wall biosynthesis
MLPSTALHVIDALNIGGAQELLVLLAKWTPPGRRMAVCVLQPNLDVGPRLTAHGVPVYALNRARPSILSPFRFLAYALGGLRDIARLQKKLGADVVHCHLSDAEFLGILAGRLAGARKVAITFHTPALLPERRRSDRRSQPGDRRGWRGWRGLLFDRRSRVGDRRALFLNRLRDRLRILAMRLIYRRADAVVAVSAETLAALRDVVGIDPARLAHIPNGVDCDYLASREPSGELRRALGLGPDDKVLLNLGRLVPLKGQIYIIHALERLAAAHPDLKLLIAGDGPEQGALAREIARLGLGGRAFLLGARADVADLLAISDLVVGASLWEGTSLALMEAMAAGRPLAVTDIPGNRELLQDGVDALMFPPADAPALAGAVDRLLREPELAARLVRAAQAKARETFDIRRVVAAYEALWA